jgi:hypothetical protein
MVTKRKVEVTRKAAGRDVEVGPHGPALTDKMIESVVWQTRAMAQIYTLLDEARSLPLPPGLGRTPEERVALILFTLVGKNDHERRQVFSSLGTLSPRELQKRRSRSLALSFLFCQQRDKISQDEFIEIQIRENRTLPKADRRGAGSVTHGALQKSLVRALKEFRRLKKAG